MCIVYLTVFTPCIISPRAPSALQDSVIRISSLRNSNAYFENCILRTQQLKKPRTKPKENATHNKNVSRKHQLCTTTARTAPTRQRERFDMKIFETDAKTHALSFYQEQSHSFPPSYRSKQTTPDTHYRQTNNCDSSHARNTMVQRTDATKNLTRNCSTISLANVWNG